MTSAGILTGLAILIIVRQTVLIVTALTSQAPEMASWIDRALNSATLNATIPVYDWVNVSYFDVSVDLV